MAGSIAGQFVYCKAKRNLGGTPGFGFRAASPSLASFDEAQWRRLEAVCDAPWDPNGNGDDLHAGFARYDVLDRVVVLRKQFEPKPDRRHIVHGLVITDTIGLREVASLLRSGLWITDPATLDEQSTELPDLDVSRTRQSARRAEIDPTDDEIAWVSAVIDRLGGGDPITVVGVDDPLRGLRLVNMVVPNAQSAGLSVSSCDRPGSGRAMLDFVPALPPRTEPPPGFVIRAGEVAAPPRPWIGWLLSPPPGRESLIDVVESTPTQSVADLAGIVEVLSGGATPTALRPAVQAAPAVVARLLAQADGVEQVCDAVAADPTWWSDQGLHDLEDGLEATGWWEGDDIGPWTTAATAVLDRIHHHLERSETTATAGLVPLLLTITHRDRDAEDLIRLVGRVSSAWPRDDRHRSVVVRILHDTQTARTELSDWIEFSWSTLADGLEQLPAEARPKSLVQSIRSGVRERFDLLALDAVDGIDLGGTCQALASDDRDAPIVEAFLEAGAHDIADASAFVGWLLESGLDDDLITPHLLAAHHRTVGHSSVTLGPADIADAVRIALPDSVLGTAIIDTLSSMTRVNEGPPPQPAPDEPRTSPMPTTPTKEPKKRRFFRE